MFTSNVQFGYPCLRGGGQAVQAGLSCPPSQDLGQTVSSVNSYCTIIFEYLVVTDVNIISLKLRCLHLTVSSVILVRGVGGKLSRLVYLAPRPGFGSGSVVSQFLLHRILEYLVVRDINIILVKLTCFHPTFSLVTLVLGVEGGGTSCPGWFILPPPPPPRIWVKQCHQLILIAP